MKIRVLGGGLYGCHIAVRLLDDGHKVELHEISDKLFSGASGNIPARLHTGAHYPRSKLTRDACQKHYEEFMKYYGDFTRHVPVNIYAIAKRDSLLDFGTYKKILESEVPFLTIRRPEEYGLQNVDGAISIDERHIVVDNLRNYFNEALKDIIKFDTKPGIVDSYEWDLTIDATFCAYENGGIDRYEVCLTVLLEGPSDRAVTVMDGPFPSLYPWDEKKNICSLTSALYTPIAKRDTWHKAKGVLGNLSPKLLEEQTEMMVEQMAGYYPQIREFRVMDYRVAIRAMPHSAADARLVDVISRGDRSIRIRAGKMDAIFEAMFNIHLMINDRLRLAA